MFKIILTIYLVSCMICLVSEVTVVMRSQANGFSLMQRQLFLTVVASILPIANMFTAYNNFVILFAPKEIFVQQMHHLRQTMDELMESLNNKPEVVSALKNPKIEYFFEQEKIDAIRKKCEETDAFVKEDGVDVIILLYLISLSYFLMDCEYVLEQ